MSACPPFRGFQWKCGQESSVRLIAIALGFWSLANDPATTADRWMQFARLAWATGYRIQHHIRYAISQKNNHSLSEACGLMLIGHLLPEFSEAARWNALGRRVFSKEILRQTYADGSYIQHSINYHRVMLHVAVLAMRLAELEGKPFGRDVYDRVGLGGEFLIQMMDTRTGHVPNYGNNDVACVLPLSECDFRDFRPAVQAVHFLLRRDRRLRVVRGTENHGTLRGFASTYYEERSPIPTVEAILRCCLPQRSVTVVGCGVPVSARVLGHDRSTEQWEVRAGGAVFTVDLALLASATGTTFIQCTPVTARTGGATAGTR